MSHHRIYAIAITFSIFQQSVNMPSGVSEPLCVTFGSVQFSGEKLLQMPFGETEGQLQHSGVEESASCESR